MKLKYLLYLEIHQVLQIDILTNLAKRLRNAELANLNFHSLQELCINASLI